MVITRLNAKMNGATLRMFRSSPWRMVYRLVLVLAFDAHHDVWCMIWLLSTSKKMWTCWILHNLCWLAFSRLSCVQVQESDLHHLLTRRQWCRQQSHRVSSRSLSAHQAHGFSLLDWPAKLGLEAIDCFEAQEFSFAQYCAIICIITPAACFALPF